MDYIPRVSLAEIIAAAQTQLDMLEDAARRPGVDVARLREQSYELLMVAISAAAEREDRKRNAAFVERVARWRAATVDVRHHLIELAEGWSCSACRSDVPSGASIDGVRSGLVRVELSCKACRKKTKLAPAGQAHFQRVFGALCTPDWNPALNGFTWSER